MNFLHKINIFFLFVISNFAIFSMQQDTQLPELNSILPKEIVGQIAIRVQPEQDQSIEMIKILYQYLSQNIILKSEFDDSLNKHLEYLSDKNNNKYQHECFSIISLMADLVKKDIIDELQLDALSKAQLELASDLIAKNPLLLYKIPKNLKKRQFEASSIKIEPGWKNPIKGITLMMLEETQRNKLLGYYVPAFKLFIAISIVKAASHLGLIYFNDCEYPWFIGGHGFETLFNYLFCNSL